MTRAYVCIVLLGAAVALSACGSSSSKSSTAASAGDRRAQVDACLKKHGINPRPRPQGNGPPGGGGFFFGGGGQPNANRSKLEAALRKCGITPRGGAGGRAGAGGFLNRPGARQALTKFVACVRKNGYNLPSPNTSGNGPVFDRSKVNTSDPKFQAAARKCQSLLPSRPAGPAPGGGSGTGTGA